MQEKIPTFFEEFLRKEYEENDINKITEGLSNKRATRIRMVSKTNKGKRNSKPTKRKNKMQSGYSMR